ncbi:uncharacterized protein LOC124261407 [Haliotis rubra]|uniref:uncharacterized protein LOC124261407 n=1 Tax=Haliotis rubra TaxID=36100 RepID=UPI001EE572CF|nr:uncharacterized protein LOC124261407 [Haliotis rubra]XP_046551679.1 uncharacterized protein LOC124261407 [Haliotis rubra]XP_046551681.1 uncharacterized protein LOC124261407 [Haliotis rubra]
MEAPLLSVSLNFLMIEIEQPAFDAGIIHLILPVQTTRMWEGDDDIDGENTKSIPTLPSLPEFDKILSDDVPRRRRRSRSPKKVQKVASGSKSVHKVKKHRPLLPKPAETTTSLSTSHSPSIFSLESSDIFDISDLEFDTELTSISIPHELSDLYGELPDPQPGTSLQDVTVFREVKESKPEQEEDPGPSSSSFSRDIPSDIPRILDLASSSSEESPVFERSSDEVVKDFVHGEEQEERQEPGPSSSSFGKKRPSYIPLTFDVSSSETEASPGFGRTSDEVVKVFVYEEDQEVKQAAAESEKSQSVLPLIKEELRTRIQLKRLISGDGDTEPDIRKPYQMTLDELKKRERKKEQNRRAALRSRLKQTTQESEIIQRHSDQLIQNEELEKQKEELKKERNLLIKYLEHHFSTGCELPRCATDVEQLQNILKGLHQQRR